MRVIKRNGSLESFDVNKIINAINKAFIGVDGKLYEDETSTMIAKEIEEIVNKGEDATYTVEDIQDLVEDKLMDSERKDVAKAFINYRQLHKFIRESNTTDKDIKELINGESEYWNEENSNKNARVVTTQRDYIAGITSTDISRRFLLTEDIVKAHDEGIIHFHKKIVA